MKIIKWLNQYFEETVVVILLMAMTVIMGAQIASRYLLNYSLSWTEELTRYLFVWSGFISISYGIQHGIAIRIEQFTMNLQPRLKAVIILITYVLELAFFVYMIPYAWNYFMKAYTGGQVSVACELPMWLIQISPFIGFSLAVVRLLQGSWREIKKIRGIEL